MRSGFLARAEILAAEFLMGRRWERDFFAREQGNTKD